jgi:hypothetical protein
MNESIADFFLRAKYSRQKNGSYTNPVSRILLAVVNIFFGSGIHTKTIIPPHQRHISNTPITTTTTTT